ncbi:hypothetical protein FisN_1Lh464 [Fistulifera solaris]|uniref:Uncharacterized protein n=1 Tax=Fistulifera solaris TaxID=1519565 RepID=A0A1Z5K183_FISSO|nr:hypothetical protein FisN_1Lh464 [Fistulifera solaris]|eukprot:GAX20055.1 hypothetical protein FisN_1Lh464 [Fistulifera solaris]
MTSQVNVTSAKRNPFVEGDYVDVESRTWPGINQPGGIGQVTGVSEDRVSVRYLVGRRHEKEILIKYVKPYSIPSERLRDRGLLKGRCTHCGSLRTDCGSCDLSLDQAFLSGQNVRNRQLSSRATNRLLNTRSVLEGVDQPNEMDFGLDSESSSSSSDGELERQQRRYRQYMHLKRKAQRILSNSKDSSESAVESEESGSDIDNIPLRQLVRQELLSQLSPMRTNQRRHDKARRQQRTKYRLVVEDSTSESEVERIVFPEASPSKFAKSVSPPGSPDFSLERTQQSDLDPVLFDVEFSSEAEPGVANFESDDDEVLDSTLQDFIQPEGDANCMPNDTVDRTATLELTELGPFFTTLVDSLENILPRAEEKVRELVRQFERDSKTTESILVLHETCLKLYDEFMGDLIRNGIDQCDRALKRMKGKPDLLLESRELRYGQLQKEINDVMKQLRVLLRSLDDAECDGDEDVDSDDGWAEPTESPERALNQESVDRHLSYQSSTSSIDLHPHARKKRIERSSLKSKNRASRKDTGIKLPKAYPRRKTQGLAIKKVAEVRHDGKENQNNSGFLHLGTSKSSSNGRKGSYKTEASSGFASRRQSDIAVERLERYLSSENANETENMIDFDSEERKSKPFRTSRESRPSVRRKKRLADSASFASYENLDQDQRIRRDHNTDDCASMPQMDNEFLSQYLLQGLHRQNAAENDISLDHFESSVECSRALTDVCDDLKKVFPNPACRSLFKELLFVSSISSRPEYSPPLFNCAISLMKSKGSVTLQELVSQQSSQLSSYVALYVFILGLLKKNLHYSLTAQHGIAYELFGKSDSKFVESLFLQLLDAVYALLHPDAWALQVSNRKQILQFLSPLRDALGEQHALVENACCLIETKLGKQLWRLVSSRRALFVSSIDPASWKLYLERAIYIEPVEKSRYQEIGRDPCIPRNEVETLWRVFVYLVTARPTVLPEKGSRGRWKFIHDIFSNGVLRDSKTSGVPSERHLQAVEMDVNTFSSIISSGALRPLPRKDSIVLDIIRKTLLLHADALWHNEALREAQIPIKKDAKNALKRELSSLESWSGLPSASFSTSLAIEYTDFLEHLLAATRHTESSTCSAGPSSVLLRTSLKLQISWMESAQCESNARLHDCDREFRKLAIYFQKESKKPLSENCDDQKSRDTFQDAFSEDSNLTCKGGLPQSRKSLFLQECAVYLLIVTELTTSAAQRTNQVEMSMIRLVDKSWEILGEELGTLDEPFEKSMSTSYDILRPYVMARVLYFLLTWTLAIIPSKGNTATALKVPDHGGNQEAICYIVAGILRCLEVSSSLGCCEVTYSIADMAKSIVSLLTEAGGSRSIASFADVLVGGCVRASIKTVDFLLRASFCGIAEGQCLVSVLSLLRMSLTFRKTEPESTEPFLSLTSVSSVNLEEASRPQNQMDDEIWGDLNDEELLGIMDSVEGCSSGGKGSNGIYRSLQQLLFALSESLRSALPSLRYQISTSDDRASRTSAQGRVLVSRSVKPIIMTLISILVSEHNVPFPSLAELVQLQVSSNADDEEFRRKVLLNCCRSLCHAVSSSRTRSLIRSSASLMIAVLIDTLLDISYLQNVPSCNFDRLPDDGNDALKRKVVDELLKFSSGNSASRRALSVWAFCRELGKSLVESSDESASLCNQIGAILLNAEWDHGDQTVVELPSSLEKEYLCRFQCIRGIITTYRQMENQESRNFTVLCAEIIARSCEGLLRILHLVRVEEVASRASPELSHAKFRLTELFRCQSEFFASILGWISREGSHVPSVFFREVWTILCTDFILPILGSETRVVYTCIEKTYTSISKFLGTPSLSFPKCNDIDAIGEYHKILSGNLINYSRELLMPMFVFEGRTMEVVDVILSFAVKDSKATSKGICRLFFKATLLSSSMHIGSKMSHHLGCYWESLLNNYPIDPKLEGEFANLKHYAIETLVVIAKRNKKESRQGALFLISSILRRERKEAGQEAINWEVLCPIIRVLPLLLNECFVEPVVDEDVVVSIYYCLHNICRLRTMKNDDVTLMESCPASSLRSDAEALRTIVASKYIKKALQWFEIVGKVVLGQAEGCDTERLRVQLKKDAGCGWLPWGNISSSETLVHASREIKEIEKQLFPNLHPDRVVHNVYNAAKRTSPENASAQKWVPSDRLRQLIEKLNK